MKPIKRKQIVLYLEFFKNQDINKLEDWIRELVTKKMFPPFHTILCMVNHRGLIPVKSRDFIAKRDYPVVIDREDLIETEQS